MKKILFLIFVFILTTTAIADKTVQMYTVLKSQKAKAISAQCSRENHPAFNQIWVPDKQTISRLESNLEKIEYLAPNLCCLKNARISNVRKYFRQYIGIVSKGRRLIGPTPPKNWLSEPIMACDGGLNFWGAIFDPETSEFSQLAINGVA